MPPSVIDVRVAFDWEFALMPARGVRASPVPEISDIAGLSLLHGNTESKKPGAGPVLCAVAGLEASRGSESCAETFESERTGGTSLWAVEGRLGLGRNAGKVGDSGLVSCKIVTSDKL